MKTKKTNDLFKKTQPVFLLMLLLWTGSSRQVQSPDSQPIFGWVSGAETEDLNSDGYPE